jgi:hypothetical protein
MSKYQCLNCDHLDINPEGQAECTGCYVPDAIIKSVNGWECPYQGRK